MQIFDSSKSLIENIYLLSGPILAVLSIAGIRQLNLTKKAIITTSKREAASLAAKQVEFYNNQIILLQNKLFIAKEKEKIDDIKIEIGEFNKEFLIEKLGVENVDKLLIDRLKIVFEFLAVINAMEAFSTYFTKGVADEEIAYSAVGRTFCFSVEDLYFDIAISLSRDENSAFQNVIQLYNLWSSRLKKEKLSKEQEKILNELNKCANAKVPPIIGTN